MRKQAWKQAVFLGVSFLTALLFWKMEQKSLVVYVPETEETFMDDTEEAAAETDKNKDTAVTGKSDRIRVLIRSDDFVSEYQEEVQVVCLTDTGYTQGKESRELKKGETIGFSCKDDRLLGETAILTGKSEEGAFILKGLKRGYEDPVYEGTLSFQKTDKGYLVINELPLELYLEKVVPSEMPSSYPMEALKAQAVCARTYAKKQIEHPRMEKEIPADVDDSVNYQVYNNQPENEACTQAVRETSGLTLTRGGELLDALYYSTSCGVDLTLDLSKETVFCSFLSLKKEKDYEKDEPWYRWNTYFSADQLTSLASSAGYGSVGTVTELIPGSREKSGCLKTLTLKGTSGSEAVEGEYSIRKLLNPAETSVVLQDGSVAPDLGMLPSAFFYLLPSYDGEQLLGYQVIGGGYGHGIGMSQTGAKYMAKDGKDFQEILTYYYGETELHEVVDTGN